jgi:formamidopyrimidine-DNA glycosylase
VPELPDVTVYVERLAARTAGATLIGVRLASPFLLRSVDPPLAAAFGRRVVDVRRLGKRIAIGLDGELFLVLHLMIAGRLRWRPPGAPLPGRIGLAGFDFARGTGGGPAGADGALIFTEASKKKRASLHLVAGAAGLAPFDRGGLEVEGSSLAEFAAALTRDNHTLKRALTDPTVLSGVGNAYSDEILHRARLSPFQQTRRLAADEMARLHAAACATLAEWTARLRAEVGDGFPDRVTAFRPEMAVHGRYRQPCPACGAPVQRIVYAENEANYCPGCQTGGRVLADRALSRLLKDNWPRTLEELEERLPSRATREGGGR